MFLPLIHLLWVRGSDSAWLCLYVPHCLSLQHQPVRHSVYTWQWMWVTTSHLSFCFFESKVHSACRRSFKIFQKLSYEPPAIMRLLIFLCAHFSICNKVLPPTIAKLHEPWVMLSPLRVSADLHGENQFERLSLVGGKMCKDHRKICSDTGRSWLLNEKKALTELCPEGLLCVSR